MSITRIHLFCVAVLLMLLGFIQTARSAHDVPSAEPLLCGIVEQSTGEAQLLDSTRTQVTEAGPRTTVPCGAWISTGPKSSLQFFHRDGYRIHVGSHSFVEVQDPDQGEPLVLYRGQIHAEVRNGSPTLKVVTANSRMRMDQGRAILLYDSETDETQLIALEHKASLENRFEGGRSIQPKAGEATTLNFKVLRLLPSMPKAVSLASLKAKMNDLRIDEQGQNSALFAAMERNERTFAAKLGATKRGLASQGSVESKNPVHKISEEEEERLKNHWVKRIVAGQESGVDMLYPGKKRIKKRKPYKSPPHEAVSQRVHKDEDAERARLMNELSKISAE